MNALVIALVVKSSLLIATASVVNALMRRRTSAASRHLVWTLALSGVLLLPVLSMTVPSWGIPVRVATETPVPPPPSLLMATTSDEVASTPSTQRAAAAAAPGETAVERAATPVAAATATDLPKGTSLRDLPWTTLALGIYLLGVAGLGLHLAYGRWTLRRLVRQSTEVQDPAWTDLLHQCQAAIGVSHPVRLLRSLDRSMPMAFGLRTPTILIPAIADTWSEDRRRAVLLHELAHIERGDCLTQLMAAVTCAAYWMHPGVWWVAKRLRVERELACDDRVLTAGTGANDYATHLLELAYSLGGYRSPALVVSMARPRQLEGRMLAVLDAARNRITPTLRVRVVGLLLMTAVVVPLAAADAVVVTEPAMVPAMVAWSEPMPAAEPQSMAHAAVSASSAPHATVATEAHAAARVFATSQAATTQSSASAQSSATATSASDARSYRRREIQLPGTWELRASEEPGKAQLRISDRRDSMHGFSIAIDQFDNFPATLLTGSGGDAKFSLKRDAGTLTFEGVFRSGVGAGTFDFVASPTFPAEMAKRGFASPTATEQYELARGNIGFGYLDELNAQKYEKPTLDALVNAANHGVHLDYLKGMGSAGYRFGQIDKLIRARDHGVTPAYIKALADEGFTNLSADEVIRARDHGVTADYVGAMRAFGYKGLPLDQVIRARDHGVNADFIRAMAEAGFKLSLEQLVQARDHGVNSEFARAMREAGYGMLTVEELINARDHGVNGDYVREMSKLGPERPSIEELVNARDHGVNADYVKGWRDLGYQTILSDMVRARDHGVTPEYIKAFKTAGYEQLTVDQLIRLRDNGVTAAFVRDQNSPRPAGKLTVDELVRRRQGRW